MGWEPEDSIKSRPLSNCGLKVTEIDPEELGRSQAEEEDGVRRRKNVMEFMALPMKLVCVQVCMYQ